MGIDPRGHHRAAAENEERTRLAGQEERRRTIELAVAEFRSRTESVLAFVVENGISLHSTAQALFASSEKTSRRAQRAVNTSSAASTSIEAAASAAEELLSSVTEISQRLGQANTLVELALQEACTTKTQIGNLADAAQMIGNVVKLIHAVAGETNLLALNATWRRRALVRPGAALRWSPRRSNRWRCGPPRRPRRSPGRLPRSEALPGPRSTRFAARLPA
jgi:methyl-accepting chemotaxis protein